MRRSLNRQRGDRWCKLEVELTPQGRLSICGSYGRVVSERAARREAIEYWRSFFEDSPDEIRAMNERCGTRFRSPLAAARYVIAVDGVYHGLDVESTFRGKVQIGEGWGQCVDEIREWFPEVATWLPWHLNDMRAECVHQEARGETYQTHPGATCGDCGYRLGSAWLRRELPPKIREEVSRFLFDGSLPER